MPDLSRIPLLSIVTFLPLAGAVLLLFFKRPPDEEDPHGHEHNDAAEHPVATSPSGAATAVRGFALFISAATFLASLLLIGAYHPGMPGFQLQEGPYTWI